MARGRHAQRRRPVAARGREHRPGRHRRPARQGARLAALAVVPLVLAGGTGAYAYWSASGTGSATVGTAGVQPLGVSTSATPPSDLYPGRVVDLPLALTNPNAYPVSLTTLTAVTVTSDDEAACPGSDNITLPSTVTTGLGSGGYLLPIPFGVPAASSSTGTLDGFLTMRTEATDACQGRTFTVTLSFSGSQA